MADKQQLRDAISHRKREMTPAQVANESRLVMRRLAEWKHFVDADCVLFYSPLPREVQLSWLWRKAWRAGKTVCFPACTAGGGLAAYKVASAKEMEKGPYGNLEPCPARLNKIAMGRIDVMLIPGLAFDRKGRRLGRGRGYYDRFLSRASSKTVKVGIAFSEQLVKRVPVNRWDIPMDCIAHPDGIVDCKKKKNKS